MRHSAGLLLLILCIPTLGLADEPLPNAAQFARLDRIFALTGSPSQTGAIALELLELVALGRTSAIQAGSETQVGLEPGELQHSAFAQASVRVHALQEIGECVLPGALEFLKNLKRTDLGEDHTQMVWPNARVALKNAILSRIADPQAKTEFLLSTLAEDGDGRSLTSYWAVNLLCDQGTSTALPMISRSFRSSWSGRRAEDAIKFCEARMQVASRDPDRVKALASVLTVDTDEASDDLVQWAVYQLGSMHSPTGDAELDRFAKELAHLREGSSQYARFWNLREDLRTIREKRAK